MPQRKLKLVAPSDGVWRIGQGRGRFVGRPADPDDLLRCDAGNRFDTSCPQCGVLYFGSSLEASFGEVLADFRPKMHDHALLDEYGLSQGRFVAQEIDSEWRERRVARRVTIQHARPFVDIDDVGTRDYIGRRIAQRLSALGVDHLDVPEAYGRNRCVTRAIATWVHDAREGDESAFAGIRYGSKLETGWECWAVFTDAGQGSCDRGNNFEAAEMIDPIPRNLPALDYVARLFKLVVE